MSAPVSTPQSDPPPTDPPTDPQAASPVGDDAAGVDLLSAVSRDIAEVPSVEIISTAALHLMSAAAVHLGLAEDLPDHKDLDEARTLIDALAGLLDASAQSLGHHHAAPLRDGLRSLQLAFKEASTIPDEPGSGPGEKYTGAIHPSASHR
jgi:hypothetical protein